MDRCALIFVFLPPAVRAATFGSWRMLTLGAEYEDTWVQSPNRRRGASKRVVQDPNPAEETEACYEESLEPSWRAVHEESGREGDTVLTLDGVSRASTRDGVIRAVWKHDVLNNSPLTQRCRKINLKSSLLPRKNRRTKYRPRRLVISKV